MMIRVALFALSFAATPAAGQEAPSASSQAVYATVQRAFRPALLVAITRLQRSTRSATGCGVARVRDKGRSADLVFIGEARGRGFRVTLVGRTGRDDFTVRNLCAAEGIEP